MKISEDQSLPRSQDEKNNENPDYWGWYDYEKQDFIFIYPKRFILDMCFPYGIEREERSETGKAYRLELITK